MSRAQLAVVQPPEMADPGRSPKPDWKPTQQVESTTVDALIRHLADLGVERAFGVSGGAIARLYDGLAGSPISIHHFRHESGAAFAAAEAHFASGKPTVVFSTTGPGILNALTGITAAKWDGAKVVFISGATNPAHRGRWATQETSSYTIPQDALYTPGLFFDFAVKMEDGSEFPEVARRLRLGLSRPGGFIGHVSLPMGIQSGRVRRPRIEASATMAAPSIPEPIVSQVGLFLQQAPFAIWVGFGARDAAESIKTLVERSNAKVLSSPKGKGVFPEDHPQYVGVTGLGGHPATTEYMVREKPRWVLVLGTRLGEATSFWDPDMTPSEGFIHVDLDPQVPGVAFPEVHTIGIQADIGLFVDALLKVMPERRVRRSTSKLVRPSQWKEPPAAMAQVAKRHPVRPPELMKAIQEHLIDGADTPILAECGNSFAWCNHHLRFLRPGAYRTSTLFGSMGHAAAGVVGVAIARKGKAVAVLGDGSMLMNSEISTAVQYEAPAVWIVLNDAGYGMCRDGHAALGLADDQLDCPRVDFVAYARAVGADGVAVDSEDQLAEAMQQALKADLPFVVDVQIDAELPSPLVKRFDSLIKQGSGKTVSGWDKKR